MANLWSKSLLPQPWALSGPYTTVQEDEGGLATTITITNNNYHIFNLYVCVLWTGGVDGGG